MILKTGFILIYDRGYAKDYFENDVKTRNNKYADTTTADTTTADTTTYATDNAKYCGQRQIQQKPEIFLLTAKHKTGTFKKF